MRRPASIVVLLTLILLYSMIKMIGVIWLFLSVGTPLEFFLVDFLYGLLCFISGVLIFFWKKQGLRLYHTSNFAMLFICIIISKITGTQIDLFVILFIPVILWLILNTFVKKTKYFEPG